MEIVINRCFGGYGLSAECIVDVLKRKGRQGYIYEQTKYKYADGINQYKKITKDTKKSMSAVVSDVDCGSVVEDVWKSGNIIISDSFERTDKDLIDSIKNLGDKANGSCASLSIIEIPDNIEYNITDYDGVETIEEAHRSWC